MLFAVLMIILFIHLDKGLVQTECCGVLQLVHRGSSHLGVICYCCGIYVFCQFTRWLPRLCFPYVSLLRRKARLVCTIGTSPCRCGDWLQMRARYLLLPSSCQPGLVSNGKSHFGRGSFGHDVQRVERATYGLYGVAANGLTIRMYVCIIVYVIVCKIAVELWVEVGQ